MPGAFREALKESGVNKLACVPTLRQAWAPHRREAGVKLRRMQAYLGPSSPTPPSVYPPRTARADQLGAEAINRLMRDR